MKEIEIKLAFDSPVAARERLDGVGATETSARVFEDNVLFDRPVEPLESSRKMLRLRRCGEKTWVTYKAPVPGEHRHKVRVEYETAVADPDAMCRILDGIGFVPGYRYQKYRTTFAIGDLTACLDETPLGCYVELEGPPDSIDSVAERMGFDVGGYIRESYRELHEQDALRRGVEPLEMVFQDGAPGSRV
jgi:adenylate cyclase class 2